MTRLKIHNMAEGGAAQADIASRCGVPLRSVERILSEPTPTRADVLAGEQPGRRSRGRPPKADTAMVARVRMLLEDERNAHMHATEVLRRAREWGFTGGRSQMSALVRRLRPVPSKAPIVRFEGLPGEYAQFDFGEVLVDVTSVGTQRVQFFAGRLKYSRMMHVVLVPDQGAETVVRSLIACLVAFGGSPKEWVFDNAKSMRASAVGVHPVVLHRHLAQLVAEYNVVVEFCAPRRGNQKGCVERLVGYVKNSFFLQRTFRDVADLQDQLAAWLHQVNFERRCDATGEIPADALREEAAWLQRRPVQVEPENWASVVTATVTPMGTVSVLGTSYSATARRLGTPATVHVRQHTIEIELADERSVHPREDRTGEVRRLPQHREDVLAALHSRRQKLTFQRQCLLELGQPAWDFLGHLVHLEPNGRWERPCDELFALLRCHEDDDMRRALERRVAQRAFTVGAVRDALVAA